MRDEYYNNPTLVRATSLSSRVPTLFETSQRPSSKERCLCSNDLPDANTDFCSYVGRLQAEHISTGPTVETVSPLGLHGQLLPSRSASFTASQSECPPTETTLNGVGETALPTPDTLQPLSFVNEAGAVIYSNNPQSDLQSDLHAQSINQRHKRRIKDSIAQPATKIPCRSPRFSVSGASTSPSRAALDQRKTPESNSKAISRCQPSPDTSVACRE